MKCIYFFLTIFFPLYFLQSQTLVNVPRGLRLITPVHYSYGCAVSSDGSVYFSEFNRQQLRQIEPDGVVQVRRLGLTGMFALAFDSSNNLFVGRDLGDAGNPGKITRISSAGIETDIVTGITRPRGLTTDSAGNVYFATESPSRISRWNKDTGTVDILVNNLLYPAEGVAVATDGTLYFSLYGDPAAGVPGSIRKRRTNGSVSTVVNSGIWRSRGLVINSTNDFLYLCTEADQEDHGNSGLLAKIKISDGTLTKEVEGIDYPQFPSMGSDGNIYFTLTRDSWLAMYNPNTTTNISDWSVNSNVKIGMSDGDWTSGGSGNSLTITVGKTLTFTGNISPNVTNGTVHGWIRIPKNLLSVDLSELYLPCLTSENPTPGIFKLPEVEYKTDTGSCLISSIVVRDHIGQRWPMQYVGTCNESPPAGFSEEPTAYLIYFSWNTSDRVNTILAPSYTDSANTLSIMKGSEPAWIYAGAPWNPTGQSWLNAGKYITTPNNTSWAEKDLGAFSGKSKYIYIMWHKNGPYRPDAARYRVYDYTEDKYNGIVNQTLHADNLDHGNDTFSGWYLLGTKKINITPSTKIRISQDSPVNPTFEYMQSDAILLSDYPIVDNTSLGSLTNFESSPGLSVGSSGKQGIGSHWGMQGLGYQYSGTNGNSFTTKLDPNIYTDLIEDEYYVEVSWDYLDYDNLNVTNAKYSVNGTLTSDIINQNNGALNQGGGFVQGNSIGTWSGFFRLDGKYAHTNTSPLIVSGNYSSSLYSGKRYVHDMVRFIPKSESATLIRESFDFKDNNQIKIYNYPNPYKSETIFSYSIPDGGKVLLKVFNINGVLVSDVVNQFQPKGNHNVKFSANNLQAGIYFYTLYFNGKSISKKMIIVE